MLGLSSLANDRSAIIAVVQNRAVYVRPITAVLFPVVNNLSLRTYRKSNARSSEQNHMSMCATSESTHAQNRATRMKA